MRKIPGSGVRHLGYLYSDSCNLKLLVSNAAWLAGQLFLNPLPLTKKLLIMKALAVILRVPFDNGCELNSKYI